MCVAFFLYDFDPYGTTETFLFMVIAMCLWSGKVMQWRRQLVGEVAAHATPRSKNNSEKKWVYICKNVKQRKFVIPPSPSQ